MKVKKVIPFVLVMPLVWMVLLSFQDISGFIKSPPDLLPKELTLKNYQTLLNNTNVIMFALNTGYYMIVSVTGAIIFTILTGYYITFGKGKAKKYLYALLLIGLTVPRFALIIPQYILITRLGLLNSLIGICLPVMYNVSYVLLMCAYLETIPKSYFDTVCIDGANTLQSVLYVYMPLCKALLSAIGVFTAVSSGSDFMWQMLTITDISKNTLIAGLNQIIREVGWLNGDNMGKPISLYITSSVLMFIPLLIIFILGNKFYRNLDLTYKE
jgi:ABC-type glycerol-3-phosphate transport system permease component